MIFLVTFKDELGLCHVIKFHDMDTAFDFAGMLYRLEFNYYIRVVEE